MIKKFKDFIPNFLQIIIIGALAIYYMIRNYPGLINVLYLLKAFLPASLIFVAIIILLVKGKLFTSHVVTFLVGYMSVGKQALLHLLSFDFVNMTFRESINHMTFIYAIIFIYFILMIFSYLLAGKTSHQGDHGKLTILVISSFLLFYFTYGFESAAMMLLPTMVSMMFGLQVASIILLLASLVDIPLQFLVYIDQGVLLDQRISYFIFFIVGLFIIYLTFKKMIKT